MGFNSGLSSTQNVNITGGQTNLPVPTAGQTIINAVVLGGNDGATIYTVTAGKIFYCLGAILSSNVSNHGKIFVNGVQKYEAYCNTNSAVATGGILFAATAGQAITIGSFGTAQNDFTIWGYEVSA